MKLAHSEIARYVIRPLNSGGLLSVFTKIHLTNARIVAVSFIFATRSGFMCEPEPKTDAKLVEFRCVKCNKLLFKATLTPGSHIEVVCTRCKEMNREPVIDNLPVT